MPVNIKAFSRINGGVIPAAEREGAETEQRIMRYRENRKGELLSVLGFGCMRLPQKGRSIVVGQAEEQINESFAVRDGSRN